MGVRIVNHGIRIPYAAGRDLLLELREIQREALESSRSLAELGEKSYRYSRGLRISENQPGEPAPEALGNEYLEQIIKAESEVYISSRADITRTMDTINRTLGAYLDIIA